MCRWPGRWRLRAGHVPRGWARAESLLCSPHSWSWLRSSRPARRDQVPKLGPAGGAPTSRQRGGRHERPGQGLLPSLLPAESVRWSQRRRLPAEPQSSRSTRGAGHSGDSSHHSHQSSSSVRDSRVSAQPIESGRVGVWRPGELVVQVPQRRDRRLGAAGAGLVDGDVAEAADDRCLRDRLRSAIPAMRLSVST